MDRATVLLLRRTSGRGRIDPLSSFDEELLLLPAEDADPNHFGGAERDLPSTPGTAPDPTVGTDVTNPICEFSLEAYLAGGVEASSTRLPLLLTSLPNRLLQNLHLVRLPPVRQTKTRAQFSQNLFENHPKQQQCS